MTEFTVRDGLVIRPGLYRENRGNTSSNYARVVASGVLNRTCVFCPPLGQTDLRDAPRGFVSFPASQPYSIWDGQRVTEHLIVIPEQHVTSLWQLGKKALRRLNGYLRDVEENTPSGITAQSYTRANGNPSKSVGHLHTHVLFLGLEPVASLNYTISDGLTDLSFATLTDSQRTQLLKYRQAI